jgi:threonine dehydrogenase-like Zn-dependent dehydrogenase
MLNVRQLTFEEAGRYAWRDVADPEVSAPEQALVRPLLVACCDVAVGDAVTDVRVGDWVVVPFQISCGQCRECRRGETATCASVPQMAMYGLGPLAGLDGGGFLSDLVLVPYADAMLVPVPGVDPVAIASLSDNIPDGWRAVGPYRNELSALDVSDRRVLVVGSLSIGLYAAAFAAAAHDVAKPDRSWEPYPVTVHTSADPVLLAATLRATWPAGTCTDTGVYYQGSVELPLLSMYTRGVHFVTGRVSARADIPAVLDLLAAGCDLAPAVERVAAWDDAPSVWPAMTGKTVFSRID